MFPLLSAAFVVEGGGVEGGDVVVVLAVVDGGEVIVVACGVVGISVTVVPAADGDSFSSASAVVLLFTNAAVSFPLLSPLPTPIASMIM